MQDVDQLLRKQDFIVGMEQNRTQCSVCSETHDWKIKKGSF